MCKLFYLLVLILALPLNHSFAQDDSKEVVIIIASNNFRDEELIIPEETFKNAGIKAMLASSSLTPARGMLGATAKPNILIQNIKVEDFAAVIFIGGSGAKEYWDSSIAHNIAIKAQEAGKVIGAICIAPVTLARAGILKGKKTTVWPGLADELTSCGAIYTGKTVEIDKGIITANGPEAANEFANAIVSALKGD